jgi:Cu/Ag efflux pump CusA
VANVYLTDDHAVIIDDGGLRRQVVSADPDDPGRFIQLARKAVADQVVLPPGAIVEFVGADQSVDAARKQLMINYAVVLFAIFALLAIAFDGRTSALVLASTLFGLAGGVVAVALLGGVMSVGATVGFIALFSLSMRSAILLFSRLEALVLERRADWAPQTVVRAARERLTPVLMTALLVALGIVVLALHAGAAGREILGPMAIVILGGLLTATLGVLFILPPLILALWHPAHARRARRHGAANAGI